MLPPGFGPTWYPQTQSRPPHGRTGRPADAKRDTKRTAMLPRLHSRAKAASPPRGEMAEDEDERDIIFKSRKSRRR